MCLLQHELAKQVLIHVINHFAALPQNLSPASPYPVMVYFFGGGFNSGGNIQYPGHFLAARDVVVVVVNYRVDIFGERLLKWCTLHVFLNYALCFSVLH